MERERLKTLFIPFKDGWFNGYYQRFEQQAQNLDRSAIEQQLQTPTYSHQLREMFARAGIGFAIFYGINKLIQPAVDDNIPLQLAYLFSVGPQYMAIIGSSVTRSIMIQAEQKILQRTLALKN